MSSYTYTKNIGTHITRKKHTFIYIHTPTFTPPIRTHRYIHTNRKIQIKTNKFDTIVKKETIHNQRNKNTKTLKPTHKHIDKSTKIHTYTYTGTHTYTDRDG